MQGAISVQGLPEQIITVWWLKQQKCFLPQFWKPEVQNPRVRRAVLPLRALQGILAHLIPLLAAAGRSNCLVYMCHFDLCLHHHVASRCVSAPPRFPSSHKDSH